jgi:branched-subunit amino acid ABC-type transport system permease component
MKTYIKDFALRGLICAAGGPLVLAIIYGILGATGAVTSLNPQEVCLGIITISVLAFIAAGCTTLYQIERLSVFMAALIHGSVLYAAYVVIYLVNGWLAQQLEAFLVFTAVFVCGYGLVWLVIYLVTRHSTEKLNQQLKQ